MTIAVETRLTIVRLIVGCDNGTERLTANSVVRVATQHALRRPGSEASWRKDLQVLHKKHGTSAFAAPRGGRSA